MSSVWLDSYHPPVNNDGRLFNQPEKFMIDADLRMLTEFFRDSAVIERLRHQHALIVNGNQRPINCQMECSTAQHEVD